MSDVKKCCEQAWHRQGNWGRHHPCKKNATVVRDGKPYCSTHDPEKVKERREKSAKEFADRFARERAQHDVQRIAVEMADFLQISRERFKNVLPQNADDLLTRYIAAKKRAGGA